MDESTGTTHIISEGATYGALLTGSVLSLFAGAGAGVQPDEWPTGFGAQQVIVTMPIAHTSAASQVSSVNVVFTSEMWTPRTTLGRRLLELREQAISKGMKLLSQNEVLAEVRRRRGEPPEDV